MAIQFVLGNSGSGKTSYIHDKIIKEADQNPDKNYLVIVPEQFTMQTQRELVLRHERHSIMNIDILSFQRLAYRIFDELGTPASKVLEETGKNLVLRRVAQEKMEALKVLNGNITKTGYIDEIKSLISELMQYNVAPEDLKEMIGRLPQGSFSYKLSDVQVMYGGFLDFLKGKFITAEEVLELLIDVADNSGILNGATLIFDGFTGFTPIQNNLLKKLLPMAETTYVAVTIDSRENPLRHGGIHELFAMSKKMISAVIKMALEEAVEVLDPVVLSPGENSRQKGRGCLFFLEQNLFRNSRNQRMVMPEEQEIFIYSLANPRAELDFTARQMEKLIRREGFRYKDLAVVCGDLPVYANYAKEIFAEYDIPVFIDQKTTIVFHPFIEFIRAILEVVEQNFAYEGIFRYLRSGLSQIPRHETDILENYVLAAGIRGHKKWNQRFSYQPKGYEQDGLEEVNRIRQKVMSQFEELWTSLKKRSITVKLISQALYQFICEQKAEEQLGKRQRELENAGDLKNAKEYAQIYRIVMDLLDKMVELLGEETITLEEYGKILDAGFEAAKVGVLPPGYDRVTFGDIERTRLDDIKVLFFVGVNDGSIPKSGGADGILSQSERETLAQQDMELAPTVRERTFMQRFYLYLNLTKPKEKLYLSYSKVNGEGKALRRSYLISVIQNMYEGLDICDVVQETLEELIVTPKNGISLLVQGMEQAAVWSRGGEQNEDSRKEQRTWAALYRWYRQREEWKEPLLQVIKASEICYENTPVAAAVTRALYGNVLYNSVTRLEKFASCAFAHFLSYGLKLSERSISSFAAVDMGNIFHEALELFAGKMQAGGYSWFEINEPDRERLLTEALQEAFGSSHNTALYENARSCYMKERMGRILRRTIWALIGQIRKGKFTPDSFEVSFAFAEDLEAVNFKLSEEEQMKLRGRIDRIDTYDNGRQMYVKVIDYKSGNTSFQFLSIYHGLQLQLVVYMNAALELMEKKYPGREVVPAGIFYYHMQDPMVEENGELSKDALRQKIFNELKLNGLVNNDRDILSKLDGDLEAGISSDVIPVGINKDGSLKKSSKAAATEEFRVMSDYVNHMIQSLGERMLGGDIGAEPFSMAKQTGCDYCEYRAVCQFDTKIPGFHYRRFEEIQEEEILNQMKGAAGLWDLNGQENSSR